MKDPNDTSNKPIFVFINESLNISRENIVGRNHRNDAPTYCFKTGSEAEIYA